MKKNNHENNPKKIFYGEIFCREKGQNLKSYQGTKKIPRKFSSKDEARKELFFLLRKKHWKFENTEECIPGEILTEEEFKKMNDRPTSRRKIYRTPDNSNFI